MSLLFASVVRSSSDELQFRPKSLVDIVLFQNKKFSVTGYSVSQLVPRSFTSRNSVETLRPKAMDFDITCQYSMKFEVKGYRS